MRAAGSAARTGAHHAPGAPACQWRGHADPAGAGWTSVEGRVSQGTYLGDQTEFRISTDVAGPFRHYFDNTDFGGMFLLRAVFQVSGDPLKIIAVVAELTNSHGAARTERIGIP